MAARTKLADSLTKLLESSSRPIYAVNGRRQIVYCNSALAEWLGMMTARIIGREVEYHSEPESSASSANDVGPLAALCPPPRALAGEETAGTVSRVGRDGRLVHRQAEFVPLAVAGGGVLVLLAATDLSPQELATEISGEPTTDELHRAIRRFRRSQASRYGLPSLLGGSSVMQKVRAQAAAAAASGANVLIIGPAGSGRSHVARTIHYRAAGDTDVKLVPLDCRVLSDDLRRRTLASLAEQQSDARRRPTLLLENLESLSAAHQSQLAEAIRQNEVAARLIGIVRSRHTPRAVTESTTGSAAPSSPAEVLGEGTRSVPTTIIPALHEFVSTITIHLPRLVERIEDLPVLAQYFLESCNQGRTKQVGSVRAEALDLLALYSWPGELDELRNVIEAAHRAATSAEITPRDLPVVIHHATSAAGMVRRQPERIVLDELLAKIERELIERALAQSGGNKTEAAAMLGMTRPRLYRRLVQLGLADEAAVESDEQLPEFVERDATEPEQ